MKRRASAEACPCGLGVPYGDCCARWHSGLPEPDAERLMRSRYCAYVMGLDDYVLATWHPDTRPLTIAQEGAAVIRWVGLEVLRHELIAVEAEPNCALVEFIARYKVNGRAGRMREVSSFRREDGRWYYLSGAVSE
ncbi:MAG: YchJ family protein [Rhodocyclaceae bacterium]|nr:YchJ family protein [Rhodocyclaceae bacterium]